MKYVKMLGLAAVAAAALMAFVGAGTASAETTLCEVTENSCSSANMYPTGTEIKASLVGGTKAVLTPSNELPTIECSVSEVEGKTETTTTPEGNNTKLSFTSCNQTVETLEKGKLQIHYDAEDNGSLTASGVRVRVKALFGSLSCDFGGNVTSGLTATGGTSPKVDATATIPMIQETGFIECPKSAVWHAEYNVTSPSPLYVSSGV
jgi:hypothetical protein